VVHVYRSFARLEAALAKHRHCDHSRGGRILSRKHGGLISKWTRQSAHRCD
jgi:hypothetical protein